MKIKISNKKLSVKVFFTILLSIIIVTTSVAIILLYIDNKNGNPSAAQEKERDSQYAEDKRKFLDTVESSDKEEDTDTNGSTFTQPSDDITIEVSESTDSVIIKTNLLNLSSGTCSITITGGSTSITKGADIIYSNSFSTCAGFTINKSDVNSKEWYIKLTVSSANGQVTKEKTYTVKQ